MNLEEQIHVFLQNPVVNENIFYNLKRVEKQHQLNDVYDGVKYKELMSNTNNQYDLSYVFNTDGFQYTNSSKVSLWPIYVTIMELPPRLRAKYTLMVGLWADKKQPNMNTFFKVFLKNANDLFENGIVWNYKNKLVNSRLRPLFCCVDSCARHSLLNMKKFNAIYGCTFCEHKTELVAGNRRYKPLNE